MTAQAARIVKTAYYIRCPAACGNSYDCVNRPEASVLQVLHTELPAVLGTLCGLNESSGASGHDSHEKIM